MLVGMLVGMNNNKEMCSTAPKEALCIFSLEKELDIIYVVPLDPVRRPPSPC